MPSVAIIGCGNIAEEHADEIRRLEGFDLFAVCDREPLMAKQLAERFEVRNCFSDVDELLGARPEIVHITTPPQSHLALGLKCIEAGCHVYLEKPFGINAEQASRLVRAAQEKNVKITVGHNAQFTPAARRMRALVGQGFLGGPPVHMESYYCYNLGNPSYAKALLGDKNHWARQLPGKLLHNIISHGISKVAEFLTDQNVTVMARAFTSPLLRSIGEEEIRDELRVLIRDGNDCTAYFTFSCQMRPVLHQLRLFGSKNSLIVDDDNQTLVEVRGDPYKSYLNSFIPPYNMAKQYAANSVGNIKRFLQRDLHVNAGMKHLISSFYRSITDDAPLPIPYREILLTSNIMDEIFAQAALPNSAIPRTTQ